MNIIVVKDKWSLLITKSKFQMNSGFLYDQVSLKIISFSTNKNACKI